MAVQKAVNSNSSANASSAESLAESKTIPQLEADTVKRHGVAIKVPKDFNVNDMNVVMAMQWRLCNWDFYLAYWRERSNL